VVCAENKSEIMQHVLKMQYVFFLLPEYINLSKMFFYMCSHMQTQVI